MHQIIALIIDQRTRLAQKDIVLHEWTIDILWATRRKDGSSSQRREPRTEEHERRIDRPETGHPGVGAAFEGFVPDVKRPLHVRLRAHKRGLLVPSGDLGGGEVQDVGHQGVEKGYEDVGFVHGLVAVCAM